MAFARKAPLASRLTLEEVLKLEDEEKGEELSQLTLESETEPEPEPEFSSAAACPAVKSLIVKLPYRRAKEAIEARVKRRRGSSFSDDPSDIDSKVKTRSHDTGFSRPSRSLYRAPTGSKRQRTMDWSNRYLDDSDKDTNMGSDCESDSEGTLENERGRAALIKGVRVSVEYDGSNERQQVPQIDFAGTRLAMRVSNTVSKIARKNRAGGDVKREIRDLKELLATVGMEDLE